MLVGNVLGVGYTEEREPVGIYRVSLQDGNDVTSCIDFGKRRVRVAPKPEEVGGTNPTEQASGYVCMMVLRNCIVLGSDNHTTSIAQKLASGQWPDEALTNAFAEIDSPPAATRLAGILVRGGSANWLGILRPDGTLSCDEVTPGSGTIQYAATDRYDTIDPGQVLSCKGIDALSIARGVLDPESVWGHLEAPATVAVVVAGNHTKVAVKDQGSGRAESTAYFQPRL